MSTKDQTYTKEALLAFDRFIDVFPNSIYIKEAKEKREKLFSLLADHDLSIADYYYKRGRFQKAFTRYLRAFELYPQTTQGENGLFMAAKLADKKLDNKEKAIELYVAFINHYPQSKNIDKAKKYLKELIKD